MNELQNDYLAFIDSLLNSMDDETFLKKYEAVKCGIGPTISSVLENLPMDIYFYESEQKNSPIVENFVVPEIQPHSFDGLDYLFAANDENYLALLAA